jgi:integrase
MAGLPTRHICSVNPSYLNLLIKLENEGKSKETVETTNKALTHISKHVNLTEPEQVKRFIAKKQCSNAHKRNLCDAYDKYAKYQKIQWEKPKYQPEARHIKIPTKEKLEMLIANAGYKMATKLQLSVETGIRPVELCNLKLKDIDLDQNLIYPTTAKHGAARTLKISNTLNAMLKYYISKNNININDKVFNITPRSYSKLFSYTRNALANKLKDPTLTQIRLYDFRHHYATMLYHKTRDILLVKQSLGHKQIENTLIYTQLLNLNEDEWICKGATTKEEAMQLIEAGFEYVTEIDRTKLFRKRK